METKPASAQRKGQRHTWYWHRVRVEVPGWQEQKETGATTVVQLQSSIDLEKTRDVLYWRERRMKCTCLSLSTKNVHHKRLSRLFTGEAIRRHCRHPTECLTLDSRMHYSVFLWVRNRVDGQCQTRKYYKKEIHSRRTCHTDDLTEWGSRQSLVFQRRIERRGQQRIQRTNGRFECKPRCRRGYQDFERVQRNWRLCLQIVA